MYVDDHNDRIVAANAPLLLIVVAFDIGEVNFQYTFSIKPEIKMQITAFFDWLI